MRTLGTRSAPRALAGLALLAVLGAGLAGCGDDEPDASPPSDPPPSSSAAGTDEPSSDGSSEEPPSEEPPSDEPPSDEPSVAPASGVLLEAPLVTANAPDLPGWEESPMTNRNSVGALDLTNGDSLLLVSTLSASGTGTPDELAETALEDTPKGTRRLDDVLVDDVPAYHLAGRDDLGSQVHEIGLVHGERYLTVNLTLRPETLRQHPDLVESVLASVRLLDG